MDSAAAQNVAEPFGSAQSVVTMPMASAIRDLLGGAVAAADAIGATDRIAQRQTPTTLLAARRYPPYGADQDVVAVPPDPARARWTRKCRATSCSSVPVTSAAWRAGIYSWLPLGLRVLRAIERVVREEMDAIGGQEIQFPALLPREPYEATNRWTRYGPNIFRLRDRKGDYLLGPTHEELFSLVVKGEYASYKDYPVILYQIQTKYRDEERPRAGILRGREFLMKDSYSFDLSDEGLAESYAKHREAYVKIFDRLALRYVIVSAMSGAMGGSASEEEFLAESETGEDTYVRGPAATPRTSRRSSRPRRRPAGRRQAGGAGPPHTGHADHRDAGRVPQRCGARPHVHGRRHPEERAGQDPSPRRGPMGLLAVGVPGDREVDMKRLEAPSRRPRSRCSTTPTSPRTRSW